MTEEYGWRLGRLEDPLDFIGRSESRLNDLKKFRDTNFINQLKLLPKKVQNVQVSHTTAVFHSIVCCVTHLLRRILCSAKLRQAEGDKLQRNNKLKFVAGLSKGIDISPGHDCSHENQNRGRVRPLGQGVGTVL